jgi:hypothetical protein
MVCLSYCPVFYHLNFLKPFSRTLILLRANALRRIAIIRRAKQDALRSFSEGRSTNP